ncbi:MAG: ATP-dependent RecD-like DNA helicase [Opitutales bacterium]|nr:ATP-dependent RecD-like DNA helicase [Opitutales bacterium]
MSECTNSVNITGVVERIVFFNEENFYCIASLKVRAKNGTSESVTITGIMPSLQCGETIDVVGEWSRHSSYGRQIKVKSFESRLPSGVYGIEKYLGSGLIDGIGPTYAKRIVDIFGEKTLDIIDSDSARLLEVKGIGKERLARIRDSWQEQKGLREVVIALRVYGIGMAMCVRIMKRFGADAPRIVREDPYKLSREIEGIGFKTADMIALNGGISNESKERICAGVWHILGEAESEGHTCVIVGELVSKSSSLLDVDVQKCLDAISTLAEEGALKFIGDGIVQRDSLEYAERRIVNNLKRIQQAPSALPHIIVDKAVQWAVMRAGFAFAPEQEQAVSTVLQNKITVITGGPGTGKTTILKAVCDILKAKKITPVLAAPTGKAAQRMCESTGVEAKTIHRLLGFEDGKFVYNEYRTIPAKFIIIDEASMLDTKLAASVIASVASSAHLVLVGDIDQLPSVGAGNVLRDIIDSKRFSVVRLNKIFRQGERSQIVSAAHGILSGDTSMAGVSSAPLDLVNYNDDIIFIPAETPDDCVATCVNLIKDKIPRWYGLDPVGDVQILAPMHKGSAGIATFNYELKKSLNGDSESMSYGGSSYAVGDKIMQTRNNYDLDIFNGDMGRVVSVARDNSMLVADFDGKRVALGKSDLIDFQQAYAISIHKSQGSEFPIVVIPLLRQHFVMLQRNLLYTAITRGRRKVFVVGNQSAWFAAVKNSRSAERKTFLKNRLEIL